MKTIRAQVPAGVRRLGVALIAAGLFWPTGCSESVPPDDAIAMVQYMPLAVVVAKGEELKRAEEYAASHPGHFAYLAVLARPLFPYGQRAGIVARDVDWNELQRGMTVVYLAQRDGMAGGMAAGVLIEKVDEGWTFKSWGYETVKPTLLTKVAYLGVVVVAFVTDQGEPPNSKAPVSSQEFPANGPAYVLSSPYPEGSP